jgi:hypothetical protein
MSQFSLTPLVSLRIQLGLLESQVSDFGLYHPLVTKSTLDTIDI